MTQIDFYKKYNFDYFTIDETLFPRLLFGTSPFIGAGQFADRSMRYYQEFYLTPQNITTLYRKSIAKGLNAIHVPTDPVIVDAIMEAIRCSEVESFVLATVEARNLQEELDLCERLRVDAILTHGSCTDRWIGRVKDILEEIKTRFPDLPTGIATHTPGEVIPRLLKVEDAGIILAPFNRIGEFMEPDALSTQKAVEEARKRGKRVIAMKPLAAGRITPQEAFEYIKDKVDGVVVGVTSELELEGLITTALSYFR